jgi:hypothetical protein
MGYFPEGYLVGVIFRGSDATLSKGKTGKRDDGPIIFEK